MSVIDYDALNEICSKISLVDYAEQTMELHRKGNKFFCSCPKHSDSDPSLCISPDVNLFYCFSCHRSGNIINWLMEYEGLSFQDAVNKVCSMTGDDVGKIQVCESLKYFKELKQIAEQSIIRPVNRAILPDSYMDRFDHNEIPQEWLDEGISADAMTRYGICIDKASNRICYPIYDKDDKLIGCKGRTRFKNFKDLRIQKYNNYTRLQRMDTFVGLKQNRNIIKQTKTVILFEGLKSGLKLCSWGLENNWLSVETSRINKEQVKILLDMKVNDITVAFDRDVEMNSIFECTSLLRRFSNVYVVRDRYNINRLLPGDKDSPVDAGKNIWLQLLSERKRI